MRFLPSPLVLPALLGLTLAACSPAPQPEASGEAAAGPPQAAAAPATPSTGAKASGTASMGAAFAITNPDLAASLPSYVELAPGTRLISHFPFSSGPRKGGSIMGDNGGSQEQVIAFHRQAMAATGLVLKPETTAPKEGRILLAESADGLTSYQVIVYPNRNGRAVFQINYHEPVT